MRAKEPKKRKAWLITWESSRKDYLADLNRQRVVAILKPQVSSSTIKTILPVLFISESKLLLSEKIGHAFLRQPAYFRREDLRRIYCGHNPWLEARLVKDLYVRTYPDTDYRQTLHWTEYPNCSLEPTADDPYRHYSEDVHFDILWYGHSLLEN